ncbi:hypothetical protein [Iningainema tapete]|uniref:Uncharacterized protein n=1 Tax=Iningainema tapete BLCC-T55 TaxID=2748662 RepID=A0A8J6XKE8_9CYAN|nr:hypothetical protein [Iningainema tapete]MBD2772027.1 hypothetical protein [Iningainema tapete BLCC-T55]
MNKALEITKIELTPDGWTFNLLSRRVGTITNPLGVRKTTYFGFDDENQAQKFQQWLKRKNKCSDAVIRQSERLKTLFEVKAWNVPTELIIECALKDLKEQTNATILIQSTTTR